jgi:hypothetical protein
VFFGEYLSCVNGCHRRDHRRIDRRNGGHSAKRLCPRGVSPSAPPTRQNALRRQGSAAGA